MRSRHSFHIGDERHNIQYYHVDKIDPDTAIWLYSGSVNTEPEYNEALTINYLIFLGFVLYFIQI
jgi:hypothetical protein